MSWRSRAAGLGRGTRELGLAGFRASLARAGYRLPGRAQYHLNASYDYLRVGAWMRAHELAARHYNDRDALFDGLAKPISHERVLYLEFGVAEGASMRSWSRLLRNPETQLHGFDSFEGLPTDWILNRPAGHFDQGGTAPVIDDPRVQFHKGWFSDSFARFEWPSGWDRLVANFDADLYVSTEEALRFVEPHLQPGSILYFDEFNHHEHELRAFDEFLQRTGVKIRALGETRAMSKIGFQTL